jgi:hypothetical protein
MHYDKYFGRQQKVFLINISEERDTTVYNSFTGRVLLCNDTHILLKTAYRLFSSDQGDLRPGMQFKLTTEALGMGVQLRAELIELVSPEELRLRPLGELSVYQRRQTARTDLRLPFLHVAQKSSLASFQREWRRVIQDLHSPAPPRLKLTETDLNLSAGGFRIELPGEPSHLALAVIDLQDGKPPVCAVAELVWHERNEEPESVVCGHRFVEILKEDQERLVTLIRKSAGGSGTLAKQRELLDRMGS